MFGSAESAVLLQLENSREDAVYLALMADNHLGYSIPIGAVVAYEDKVSPSAVGYDIGCGNKAVRLDIPDWEVRQNIHTIMDDIYHTLSFGLGRKNHEKADDPVLEDPTWNHPEFEPLHQLASEQLGTIGSGNHFVDIFVDEADQVWVGVHMGSRGLGHKIASQFIKKGGGKDGIMAKPVLLDVASEIGQDYLLGMELAGRYAYAGRDWVCDRVAQLLGASILEEVHNHHNYAWYETHFGHNYYVIRKGATPAFPGQRGFIGGSMGDISVIVEGIDSKISQRALYSTVHGAGRVMSRSEASGKRGHGKEPRKGAVTRQMMMDWLKRKHVTLRGGDTDESPHCYKRIEDVLELHEKTISIVHTLTPLGVAMAGSDIYDPYKD